MKSDTSVATMLAALQFINHNQALRNLRLIAFIALLSQSGCATTLSVS